MKLGEFLVLAYHWLFEHYIPPILKVKAGQTILLQATVLGGRPLAGVGAHLGGRIQHRATNSIMAATLMRSLVKKRVRNTKSIAFLQPRAWYEFKVTVMWSKKELNGHHVVATPKATLYIIQYKITLNEGLLQSYDLYSYQIISFRNSLFGHANSRY